MATERTVHQLNDEQGKATRTSVSAPDWFALDNTELDVKGVDGWGPVFSLPRPGNEVQFFWTGSGYFADVKRAIEGAKKCVFIAGWQINFDVELTPGNTLMRPTSWPIRSRRTCWPGASCACTARSGSRSTASAA